MYKGEIGNSQSPKPRVKNPMFKTTQALTNFDRGKQWLFDLIVHSSLSQKLPGHAGINKIKKFLRN